ncbi:hypothetical protein SDC9_146620 [bioreactor metagenome]|uniref:Uncharacterized protein n=1 Tax=bioreactor metagenome TaxID=1076179 RepID=A0A645EDK3_9ZZZZ
MKAYVLQHPLGAFVAVSEAYILKIHGAGFHCRAGLGLCVGDGGNLIQHLTDALCAGDGAGHHHKNHGNHHQGNQNFRNVGEKGGEAAHLHGPGENHFPAEPHDGNDGSVDNQHHHGHVHYHSAKGFFGGFPQAVVPFGEFLLLMLLTDKGFYHPDAGEVFLHH